MKCPNDQTTLVITERANIEIDYCPECRGVWLDRGELDKIIDRSAESSASSTPHYAPSPAPHHDDRHHEEKSYDPRYQKKRRKESFLGDLFDF